MVIGYTTGVYDLFHIGHLNLIKRAKELCDYLIVGVSTDELVMKEKSKSPVIPYEERVAIIESLRYVDEVVPQLDKNKLAAWERFHFDMMFVGSDWKGTTQWNGYEEQFEPLGVDIIYLPYSLESLNERITSISKIIIQSICTGIVTFLGLLLLLTHKKFRLNN